MLKLPTHQIKQEQVSKLLDLGIYNCDRYVEVFEVFENKYSIFVDVTTYTSVNEILGFKFSLKSWMFTPIQIGDFQFKEEGQSACLDKILEIVSKIELAR